MKKRTLILVALCALTLAAGCGNEAKENGAAENQNTESEANENTETAKRNYKALDYVTLGEYTGIEVSAEKAEVTEEDIKEYVENMLAYYPAYENVDKTVVEDGDTVNIDYEGLLDDVAFDGGTASGQYLEIGSDSFIDGFEEGLIGVKVGDKVSLDLTFPETYSNNPDLVGKAVVFNVTVNSIVEKVDMTYDTLTDEYVASNFNMDNVQAFKDNVQETLTSTNEYYAQSDARSALLDKVREIGTVNELPEGVLDERVNQYKTQFETMCKESYSMELADYLEQTGMTEEEFNTQVVEYMQESIELELVLLAIAETEGIELDEEGFASYVSSMTSNYGYEDESGLYEDYGESFIQDSYVCNKVVDMLMESANITYTQPAEEEASTGTEETADGEDTSAGTEETADGEDASAETADEEDNSTGTADEEDTSAESADTEE